ncbi:MAG: lecithin retinol acyltransferase family protein [Cyanobacteria bacterium]|nr:lecithin retinol acyltransferase family protein [Cyanobacteriota bacterium]MDW8201062.1 lecithin retinol acyltransferase family protein [Cyanobacteriota bacterium SKYGB_h_bin112]
MARGDQIYTLRDFMNMEGLYEHHGIDCGDGTVIHYRKGTETVTRTSLEEFTDGRPIYVKTYKVSYIPDVTVRRAESRLGEQEYNLLTNNCEHFATWCKTGVSRSAQVENFVSRLPNFNIDELGSAVFTALQKEKDTTLPTALQEALTTIKTAWDDLLPKYDLARHDYDAWSAVAMQALQKGRDDLARAAIQKKLAAKKLATEFKAQLDQLAKMTENLTRQSRDFNIKL